jgi:type III secretion protein C
MNERESLLIGGFNSESDTRQTNKVPGFSDVPFFGLLFKKKSTTVEKRERLFLITPKILSAGNEVSGNVE